MSERPGIATPGVLRVGLAVRDLIAPMWVEAVAKALLQTGFVELSIAVLAGPPVARTRDSAASGLWRAYQRLDLALQRLACASSPDPSATADLEALGGRVSAEPAEGLDLVINAAGPSLIGVLSKLSGAPVWWFDHDGHEAWPSTVSGYPETVVGRHVTGCRLLCLAPDGTPPRVLREAFLATHPLFGAENRVQLLWKSIPLLLQKVRELHDEGAVVGANDRQDDVERSSPHAWHPASLSLTLAGHAWRSAGFSLRRLAYREQWFLLAGRRCDDGVGPDRRLTLPAAAFRPTRRLIPPGDRFWADPHLLPDSDDRLILVEEYLHAERRGRIALIRLDERDEVAEVRTVLDRDCHLSYPSLFLCDGELYMVPESSELQRVEAYRCREYPWSWELASTLLSGVRACDSTVFEHGGRWWLFATVVDESWLMPRDTLHVFFSDDPVAGPWHPHPGNPCVCDVRCARPAGLTFVRDGRLFRPGQDCSRGYGYGIRINEVTVLTESRYEEREVGFVGPDWPEVVATHTLTLGERTTMVDGMRWLRGRPRSRPPAER